MGSSDATEATKDDQKSSLNNCEVQKASLNDWKIQKSSLNNCEEKDSAAKYQDQESTTDITEPPKQRAPTTSTNKAHNEPSLKDKPITSDKTQTIPETSRESPKAGQGNPDGFLSKLKARILTYITSHQNSRPSIGSISGRQKKSRHKQRPASPQKQQTMPEHSH